MDKRTNLLLKANPLDRHPNWIALKLPESQSHPLSADARPFAGICRRLRPILLTQRKTLGWADNFPLVTPVRFSRLCDGDGRGPFADSEFPIVSLEATEECRNPLCFVRITQAIKAASNRRAQWAGYGFPVNYFALLTKPA
jgi:hypothetical protein